MKKYRGQSIPKPGMKQMNEDAVCCGLKRIAVADGAGGGGVYADCWARYLLKHLPDTPIRTSQELDDWLDSIWETFYNTYEEKARRQGGLILDKFYQEGSFATLVAVWRTSPTECEWMSYGDSVAFCYEPQSGRLQHSFTQLADFQQPPYLINCKDPLCHEGFRHGTFCTSPHAQVFVATDALSQYILQQYAVTRPQQFAEELETVLSSHHKAANALKLNLQRPVRNFGKEVVRSLYRQALSPRRLKLSLYRLCNQGVLFPDDYSIAFLPMK